MLDTGYETLDDDDLDGVLVEDETGVEARIPREVVFELALDDVGSATELAREAGELGYAVEVRAPDDGEGFFEVTCSRTMLGGPAAVAQARRELEAIAEEVGGFGDDDEHETEPA